MRGKRAHYQVEVDGTRNIPAYAGKTMPMIRTSTGWEEHPRVCGENEQVETLYYELAGTSPRMRGKPIWAWYRIILGRNIPAYAGKTTLLVSI